MTLNKLFFSIRSPLLGRIAKVFITTDSITYEILYLVFIINILLPEHDKLNRLYRNEQRHVIIFRLTFDGNTVGWILLWQLNNQLYRT